MTSARRVSVGVERGYDRWADAYDTTPNPVVWLDQRVLAGRLRGGAGCTVLDVGCGTGRHLGGLARGGARVIGVDLSAGMLAVARRRHPSVGLARGRIDRLPVASGGCDAVLCALVGEHVAPLAPAFAELARVLRPGGRLLFSVYHPAMARRGAEASFERDGVEYRLGAHLHSVADYRRAAVGAGLRVTSADSHHGGAALSAALAGGARHAGRPVLWVLDAVRA